MLLLSVVTAGPKHLAADCPDFPKSSSDPHCGLRILIGRIFLSSHSHPSLNAACNNHLCRKVTVRMRTTIGRQPAWRGRLDNWTFRGELTSIILILGFLSLAPIIRFFGHLPCLACLKSGHLITPAPASASAQRVCLAPEKAQISSAPLFCLSTYLCISYIRMRCYFTPF